MVVEITDISLTPVTLSDGKSKGFWGGFKCPLGEGRAIFVPYSGREDRLTAARQISVETSYSKIDTFALVGKDSLPMLMPLETAGDYQVTGKVVAGGDGGCWVVSTLELDFLIGEDELTLTALCIGDWITFCVRQLELYDENI